MQNQNLSSRLYQCYFFMFMNLSPTDSTNACINQINKRICTLRNAYSGHAKTSSRLKFKYECRRSQRNFSLRFTIVHNILTEMRSHRSITQWHHAEICREFILNRSASPLIIGDLSRYYTMDRIVNAHMCSVSSLYPRH